MLFATFLKAPRNRLSPLVSLMTAGDVLDIEHTSVKLYDSLNTSSDKVDQVWLDPQGRSHIFVGVDTCANVHSHPDVDRLENVKQIPGKVLLELGIFRSLILLNKTEIVK